jgi:hypothetical protein
MIGLVNKTLCANWSAWSVHDHFKYSNNCVTNLSNGLFTNLEDLAGCGLYSFILNTGIIGVVCVVGLLCNIMSFVLFYLDHVKTSTSFLLQALTVADSLLLILTFVLYCVPNFVEFTELLQGFKSVHPYVLVYLYPLASIIHTISVWVTVLVGINRHAVVHSRHIVSHAQMMIKTRRQLVCVIFGSICYNIPKFYAGRIQHNTDDNTTFTSTAVSTMMGRNHLYNVIYSNGFYIVFM